MSKLPPFPLHLKVLQNKPSLFSIYQLTFFRCLHFRNVLVLVRLVSNYIRQFYIEWQLVTHPIS